MSPFKILEHTGDFIIQAQGKTLEELFSETMRGMFEAIRPKFASKEIIKREIEIKSMDLKALLVDFLSEALYQSDINNEAYFQANFKKFSETELKAELIGKKIDSFEEEIKAVTHHGLKIEKIDKSRSSHEQRDKSRSSHEQRDKSRSSHEQRDKSRSSHEQRDEGWQAEVLFDI